MKFSISPNLQCGKRDEKIDLRRCTNRKDSSAEFFFNPWVCVPTSSHWVYLLFSPSLVRGSVQIRHSLSANDFPPAKYRLSWIFFDFYICMTTKIDHDQFICCAKQSNDFWLSHSHSAKFVLFIDMHCIVYWAQADKSSPNMRRILFRMKLTI